MSRTTQHRSAMTTEEMLEKVRQGYTLKEIGEMADITDASVHQRLTTKQYATQYKQYKAEYKHRRALMVQEELKKGATVEHLAKKYGVTMHTVCRYGVGL